VNIVTKYSTTHCKGSRGPCWIPTQVWVCELGAEALRGDRDGRRCSPRAVRRHIAVQVQETRADRMAR